jgi:hypothetical protein
VIVTLVSHGGLIGPRHGDRGVGTQERYDHLRP